MRRFLPFFAVAWLVMGACADDAAPTEAARCVAGASRRCPCAGNATGIQTCQDDGTYNRCGGCGTGAGGAGVSSGGSSTGGQGGKSGAAGKDTTGGSGGVVVSGGAAGTTNGGSAGTSAGSGGSSAGSGGATVAGSGGTSAGTGGAGGGGAAPVVYVQADCLSGDPPVNDTEICDDGAFQPVAGTSYVLACMNQNGGIAYVATNTGPPDTDGTPRCQGWEHSTPPQLPALSYLAKISCLPGSPAAVPIDLSAYVGKTIYYGAHLSLDGSGKNTAACLAGSKEPPDPACAGTAHCSNGQADCGEAGIDCGAGCAACVPPGTYVYTDCKTQEAPSNGSEDCDDTSIQVQAPGTQYVLVCFSHAGGTAYVSTNTGPVQSDGHARCQGWEDEGKSAPDFLQYVTKMTCDADQKTLPLDLSAYVGQNLHMGTHLAPDGSGHGTVACVALKKLVGRRRGRGRHTHGCLRAEDVVEHPLLTNGQGALRAGEAHLDERVLGVADAPEDDGELRPLRTRREPAGKTIARGHVAQRGDLDLEVRAARGQAAFDQRLRDHDHEARQPLALLGDDLVHHDVGQPELRHAAGRQTARVSGAAAALDPHVLGDVGDLARPAFQTHRPSLAREHPLARVVPDDPRRRRLELLGGRKRGAVDLGRRGRRALERHLGRGAGVEDSVDLRAGRLGLREHQRLGQRHVEALVGERGEEHAGRALGRRRARMTDGQRGRGELGRQRLVRRRRPLGDVEHRELEREHARPDPGRVDGRRYRHGRGGRERARGRRG